ncbi:hypothetical protein L0244_38205 [bacterium]|nr:hypothetical protein [bacterium]MCI0618843.1 hypothetical protein [bacterium]
MSRILKVSDSLLMYSIDHGDLLPEPPVPTESFAQYPDSQNYTSRPRLPNPWPKHKNREVTQQERVLGSKYVANMPTTDYLGNPLYFDISKDRKHFIVMSLGSDGLPDSEFLYWYPPSETWRDIACYDLVFLSSPQGTVH